MLITVKDACTLQENALDVRVSDQIEQLDELITAEGNGRRFLRARHTFLVSQRANAARLQSAVELGRTEMNEGSELYQTPLRALLYALMELVKGVDGDEVLRHLAVNAPGYFDAAQRGLLIELAGYLAGKLASLRPEEASAARVLGELMRGQRL